jgi:hypothetical protein
MSCSATRREIDVTNQNRTHQAARRRGIGAASLAVAAAATLALAPSAGAKPQTISGGTTTLKMTRAVAEFFADTGTKVKAIKPAKDKKSGIQFPIKSGELDPKKAKGSVKQDGGISLKGDGGKAEVTKLAVKFAKSSKVTAKVDGDKERLFKLDTDKAKAKRTGSTVTYSKVKVITTRKGATLIEEVTDMELEEPDFVFGKLKVNAETGGGDLPLSGGDAGLVLDPAARTKLDTEGIARAAVSPATRQGDEYSFPVLGGKVAENGGSGEIRLDGGIRLTRGATNLELTKPRLHLGDGEITALVDGERRTVMSFPANRVEVTVDGENVTVTGFRAKLTEEGATAINDAFGGGAFAEGDKFGELEVAATSSQEETADG